MNNTFQIGTIYETRSVCDYDCIFQYEVIRRSAKFITVSDRHDNVTRVGVKTDHDGNEWARMGNYSMAPIIRAEKKSA